jgi:serine/alanine adding enzyme
MSTFQIVTTLDHEQWNTFVHGHPKGTIFHTSYMDEVYRQTKNTYPLMLAALDSSGEILALLTAVRVQTLPNPLGRFSSRSIWYAEPLCVESNQGIDALAEIVQEHDRLMQNRVLFTEIRPVWAAGPERIALERCRYHYMGYLNYVVDISQPIDTMLSNMRKSCRSGIRRFEKRGMEIRDVTTEEGIDMLYHFATLSYENSHVPLADKSMFTSAFKILNPHAMVKVFVAYYDDKPIAADIDLNYKHLEFAWYGGLERIKGVSPAENLTWHQFKWGHEHGYTMFDFGGAGWPDEPYGVRDFKAKFGGKLVNYGRYRRVYSYAKLRVIEKAYQLLRKYLTKRSTPEPDAIAQTATDTAEA